jgi:hypothetical protein
MRSVVLYAVALGVVVGRAVALGQEEAPPSNYEHLKGLAAR